jgi:hypothetical protein
VKRFDQGTDLFWLADKGADGKLVFGDLLHHANGQLAGGRVVNDSDLNGKANATRAFAQLVYEVDTQMLLVRRGRHGERRGGPGHPARRFQRYAEDRRLPDRTGHLSDGTAPLPRGAVSIRHTGEPRRQPRLPRSYRWTGQAHWMRRRLEGDRWCRRGRSRIRSILPFS